MEFAPRDGTEIVVRVAGGGGAWVVTWSLSGWKIKKPPGRDPILYIDPVEWLPLPATVRKWVPWTR